MGLQLCAISPERQEPDVVEEGPQCPLDTVTSDGGGRSEEGGALGQSQPLLVKDQGHPG